MGRSSLRAFDRNSTGRGFSRWIALLLAVASWPAANTAQSVKLNGPLAQPLSGDVTDSRLSPGGTHVVYRADQDSDEVFELFAAPLDGSAAAVRLHAPLSASSPLDVTSFAPASSGLVVYVADLGADEVFELYSAPLAGSASPTLLSGPLVSGGDVQSFQLTSDGTQAVFLADKLVDGREELFSVPVDGSAAPLRLDPNDRECTLYGISPDGSWVVFTTVAPFGLERLHRVPTNASQSPVALANSGAPGGISYTFFEDVQISSDNQHGSYVAVEVFFDRGSCVEGYANLFGFSLAGTPAPALLNMEEFFCSGPPNVPVGSRVVYTEFGSCYSLESDGTDRVLLGTNVTEFVISPDESRVVFLSGSPTAKTLYVAPIDGSSAPLALDGPGRLESPRMTAGSSLVTYISTHTPTSFRGLFTVHIDGGTPLFLNGPVITGERGVRDFALSSTGLSAVYAEDRAADEVFQLFSVTPGPVQHELSGPLDGFRDVFSYEIAPDGERVVYLADQNSDEARELFGTPLDSGTPLVQYNPTLPNGPVLGDVLAFQATADGSRVVYRADQDVDEFFDLYSVRADGSAPPVRLTEPLTDGGDVLPEFVLTPAGDRVVFQFFQGNVVLYSRPTSGAGPSVALASATSGFEWLTVDPGGTHVFYRESNRVNLLRAPVDGSAPAMVVIHPPAPGDIVDYDLTPDGQVVIYRMWGSSNVTELYRRPSDASAPSSKLSAPMANGGDVISFRVAPDGSRVVYRADQETDDRFEVYSVPSAGGPAVKLNGPLTADGDVSAEFQFTADSSRVVYRADQTINDTFELYSVPANGSAAALRLTVLASGRVEPDFVLSADGAFAFYRADALSPGITELFAVPTDASASPVRLSATLVAGGDVMAFALGSDPSRIVYLADQNVNQVYELFSVPVIGGTPVPLANLSVTADVTSFRIVPGGQRVVYLADLNADGRFELFRSPLDGSAPPERLNRDLAPGGDVQPDFVPLAGDVLFRADAEANDAFELFNFRNRRVLPSGPPTGPMVVR